MSDEIINVNEIYLQDVVCTVVARNPNADDFAVYNMVSQMADVDSLETLERILKLIKLNKTAFQT